MTQSKQKTVNKMSANKSKRKVPRVTYNVGCVKDYLHYAGTNYTQSLFINLAVDSIKHGIIEQKDTVDVFTLPGENNHTVMSLKKSEWKLVLNNAIKFYSKSDQFEKCIDCQQLLNTIK